MLYHIFDMAIRAALAQSVERILGKDEVGSSSLLGSSNFYLETKHTFSKEEKKENGKS